MAGGAWVPQLDGAGLGLGSRSRGWPETWNHLSPGSQVLFNVASAQCCLGLWAQATRSLEEAISKGPEGARKDLRTALDQVQVRGQVRGQVRRTRPALPLGLLS